MLLWAITVDDIIAGLRERGLQNDPTRRELDLICQYTDSALDDAARRLLDMLMARIRQVLGSSVRELHEPRTLATRDRAVILRIGYKSHVNDAQQFCTTLKYATIRYSETPWALEVGHIHHS